MPEPLLPQTPTSTPRAPVDRAQRRTLGVLAAATILGGLGVGASLSAGALLIVDVTGDDALSGFGSTMNAVGAAVAGMPLARLAMRRGRRVALATGNAIAVAGALLVVVAAHLGSGPLLFAGLGVLGIASAVQLGARFAAADLARPERRARDLSLVVWSITVGAVAGPNLIAPGEALGEWLGIPPLAGVFVFTVAAQVAAGLVVWCGLRPDPLLEARRRDAARPAADPGRDPEAAATAPASLEPRRALRLTIAVVSLAHAVMVGLMALTPLHITHHGGSVTVVGVTISLHIAGMYALSPLVGLAAARFGRVRVMSAGLALLALAAAGTALGGARMAVIQVALILLGVGWSLVTVAGAALLTELAPIATRARRQGQSDTAMNAAGALFGAAAGALFALGAFPLLSAVAAAIVAAAAVCAALLGADLARRGRPAQ